MNGFMIIRQTGLPNECCQYPQTLYGLDIHVKGFNVTRIVFIVAVVLITLLCGNLTAFCRQDTNKKLPSRTKPISLDKAFTKALKAVNLRDETRYTITIKRSTKGDGWLFNFAYVPSTPGGYAIVRVNDDGTVPEPYPGL